MTYSEIMAMAPSNETIQAAIEKAWWAINSHQNIMVSISGGSDSDIMLDLIEMVRQPGVEVTYVFFYTGLEYEATKRHLKYLEEKYKISIEWVKPMKPIPKCAMENGQPFLSKHVSEMIMRLQKHNFKWEDEPFDVLYKRYPKCKSALWWWCGEGTMATSIHRNKCLKEFIMAFPPTFKISSRCCHYAKKKPLENQLKQNNYDLNVSGIRRCEGGIRQVTYKSCFDRSLSGPDSYRPLFWFTNEDKAIYKEHYGIKHSDCYEIWGMTRTGCSGCPFGRDFNVELDLANKYEPKFSAASKAVFSDSYAYTNEYKECRRKKEQKYDKS